MNRPWKRATQISYLFLTILQSQKYLVKFRLVVPVKPKLMPPFPFELAIAEIATVFYLHILC